MSISTQKLSLKNFFIYNVSYGQKEGEEDQKIMYYFPKDTPIDNQVRDVGLSEAIIKFSRTFTKDSCEALQTQKKRCLFFQPEPNFWLVLTVNVPTALRGRDGLEGIEYVGFEVQNVVFSAVLRQAYSMAKLFIGPFTPLLDSEGGDPTLLKKKLENFFIRYLLSLRLDRCDILDIFQGLSFLPLDKKSFLHSQCFVNQVEAALPLIDFSLFLYNNQLVWSGLPPDDAQVVYKYIKSSLLPSFRETTKDYSLYEHLDQGRFVTGPSNLETLKFTGKTPPKVYLSSVADPGFYQLVVYQFQKATLCLFIRVGGEEVTMGFFRELDRRAGSRLGEICAELKEALAINSEGSEAPPGPEETRWVYFNKMNLATKSTIHDQSGNQLHVTKEVLRILVDIHSHHLKLMESGCHSGETFIRTLSNRWIVGKMSNSREFYVTINRKRNNLTEVNEEVKKICDKQLKSIFFHV